MLSKTIRGYRCSSVANLFLIYFFVSFATSLRSVAPAKLKPLTLRSCAFLWLHFLVFFSVPLREKFS
jgi:hypothetical protein